MKFSFKSVLIKPFDQNYSQTRLFFLLFFLQYGSYITLEITWPHSLLASSLAIYQNHILTNAFPPTQKEKDKVHASI